MSEHIGRRGIHAVTVASLGVSALVMSAETQPYTPPPSTVYVYEQSPTKSPSEPECQAIATAGDIAAAKRLIAEPGSPYANHSHGIPDRDVRQQQLMEHTAAKYGLTASDGETLWASLFEKINGEPNHSPSFAEVLATAQKFVKPLGIQIEIGDVNDPGYTHGSRRPTAKELESRMTKNTVNDIIDAYSNVPKEYVSLAGLKKIYLVAGTKDDVVGYPNKPASRYRAYYEDISGGDVGLHELSHMVDQVECTPGSIFSDDAWSKLNGAHNIYTGEAFDKTHLSYIERYVLQHGNFQANESGALSTGDVSHYCELVKKDDQAASQVLTYSEYHPNVAEDKAETIKNISNPYRWVDLTSSRLPYLKAKFTLTLARLYHIAPRLAEYFAETSGRTDKPLNTFNFCK